MILKHAVALAEARSYIAALADQADSTEASANYEHVLLALDLIHGIDSPALNAGVRLADQDLLYVVASSALAELADLGVDALQVGLLLDMLRGAHEDGEA